MLHAVENRGPVIESVTYANDHSHAGDRAFAHALAIALTRQSKLTLLNVAPDADTRGRFSRFPPVRQTLEQWNVLKPNSPRSAVYDQLNMRVKKVAAPGVQPAMAAADYLDLHPADLVVFSGDGHGGLPSWVDRRGADALAGIENCYTLFVPDRPGRGLIGTTTGELRLANILVPVDRSPDYLAAAHMARSMAETLGKDVVTITLAHVGSSAMQWPALSDGPHWRWQVVQFAGDPVSQVLSAADDLKSDLIVMPTRGDRGLMDVLHGRTTEQVLRMSSCPVLAVPPL